MWVPIFFVFACGVFATGCGKPHNAALPTDQLYGKIEVVAEDQSRVQCRAIFSKSKKEAERETLALGDQDELWCDQQKMKLTSEKNYEHLYVVELPYEPSHSYQVEFRRPAGEWFAMRVELPEQIEVLQPAAHTVLTKARPFAVQWVASRNADDQMDVALYYGDSQARTKQTKLIRELEDRSPESGTVQFSGADSKLTTSEPGTLSTRLELRRQRFFAPPANLKAEILGISSTSVPVFMAD